MSAGSFSFPPISSRDFTHSFLHHKHGRFGRWMPGNPLRFLCWSRISSTSEVLDGCLLQLSSPASFRALSPLGTPSNLVQQVQPQPFRKPEVHMVTIQFHIENTCNKYWVNKVFDYRPCKTARRERFLKFMFVFVYTVIRAQAVRNSLDQTLNVEELLFLSDEQNISWREIVYTHIFELTKWTE